jgi:hypothetical protein
MGDTLCPSDGKIGLRPGNRLSEFEIMSSSSSRSNSALSVLGWRGVGNILWRYFREKAQEQFRSIWFIIAYLVLFQTVILGLPVVHSATIALGVGIVVLGLTFFMEGLRLGLMPFGETIGAILPRNSRLPLIMVFSFLLGVGATLAEPAISVLKKAGAGVNEAEAPLLYSLLNQFSGQLVAAVGVGVGIAVMLGILRFFYGWSLKWLILPIVAVLSALTLWAYFDPLLNPVIGLAWDCGAVTTGPVTVPLVLALGIGVCRIVGAEDAGSSGFGIVTLASLFPVLAVLILAIAHLALGDFRSPQPGVPDGGPVVDAVSEKVQTQPSPENPFSAEEFESYKEARQLPESYRTWFRGGEVLLEDGRIVHRGAEIVIEKAPEEGSLGSFVKRQSRQPWDSELRILPELLDAVKIAAQAILPL